MKYIYIYTTVFSDSGGLKTLRFVENFESNFLHKTNAFSSMIRM